MDAKEKAKILVSKYKEVAVTPEDNPPNSYLFMGCSNVCFTISVLHTITPQN